MKRTRTLLYIFFSLCCLQLAFGQSDYGSENELVKQAGKSFEAGDYFAAAPLYSQLSSLYPKDAIFNYRCGVCFLFTEKDKNKSITPLTSAIATQNPKLPAGAHYYLGKAYHLTNQLEEAENEYNRFLQSATPKELENSDVNRLIEMSRNARSINASAQLIDIVDRQTVSKEAFVSGYDLNPYKIKVLSIPENYRSPADKKRNENKNLYLMRGSGIVMFSSIGNERTDKDIFIIRNFSPDNNASPENLGKNINTPYDEDYPFLTPDGKTLYFSSKGHNSIGGYDLFKSTWNESNQTWNKPENLGTPINSTDDDFFLVMADGIEDGYFATMRESSFDKVTVMKFRIRTKPLLFSSVSASFNQLNAEKENEVRITAYTIDQSRMAGIFSPNRSTHDYNIALRAGSDFIIKVEYPGFKTVYDTLKNPVGDGSVQTVQKEIRISDGAGDDKTLALLITAHQITPVEEQQIQKQVEAWKADPANAGKEPEALALNSAEELKVSTEKETSEQSLNSNKEIIENAEKEGGDLKAEATQLKREATQLHDDANQKQALAKAKEAQAEDLRKQIEATTDPALKATFASRVDKLSSDAELLNKEAELLTFEAQRKEELATRKSREAEFAANDAKTLQQSASNATVSKPEVKTNTNAIAPTRSAEAYSTAASTAAENSKNLKQESADLYQQAEEIKKEAAGITDENEKEKTLTRAFNIEMMAKKRQDEAQAENERALAFNDSAGSKQSNRSTQQALVLKEEGNRLNTEAKALNTQAKALSQQAKSTEDPIQKKELARQAMQLLNQEAEKKKLAEEKYAAARQAEENTSQPAAPVASNTQQPVNVQAVLDNPRITEPQKQEIVALLVESNTKQAQATAKQAEAKSTAAASRNTLDAEEKKNLSRKAIQLMNESSNLVAEAEEKAQQASALEITYASQASAVASSPVQTDSTSTDNAYIAQADATNVVMEKQNGNENGNEETKVSVNASIVTENKTAAVENTPKTEAALTKETVVQENTTTAVNSLNSTTSSQAEVDPEAARAEAMTLRTESEELKISAKNLKYEANNSESEKEKSDKLKEAMTLLKQSDAKAQRADSLLLVSGLTESEDNTTATLTPENKQRVDEVTASAAEKQKQAELLEAEARAKSKTSDTLVDEEQRQREKLAALALVESAEAQKAEAQQEAEKAARLEQELKERERREREIYALAELKEEKIDSDAVTEIASVVLADNPQAERLEADAAQLKQEANSLNAQAEEVQKTARRMANPADKSKFMKQSDQLRLTAESKQKEADDKLATAKALRNATPTLADNTTTDNKQESQSETPSRNDATSTAPESTSGTPLVASSELKNETERLYAEAVATENEARNLEAQADEQKQIANTAKKKKARKAASAEAERLSNLAALKKEEANSKFAEVEKLSASALAKNTDEAKTSETKETKLANADGTEVLTENKQTTPSDSLVASKEFVNAVNTSQEPLVIATEAKAEKEPISSVTANNEVNESAIAADTKAIEEASKSEAKEQAGSAETKTTEPSKVEENNVVAQAEKTEPKTNEPVKQEETVVAENTNTAAISTEKQAASTSTNTEAGTSTAIKAADTNTGVTNNTQPAVAVGSSKKISINRNAVTSAYGPSNPIPVNPTLSNGLIFKIQIGAFRNPVPAEIFKGMEPLIGETTASGLTRYLAGDFGAFEPANWAKNEVRALGYKDAFVVAYNNGKRISIPEARAIIAAMQPAEKSKYEQLAKDEMLALKENNIYPEKYNNPAEVALVQSFNQPGASDLAASNTTTTSNTAAAQSNETAATAQSQQNETQGTRYTVQVGVYRNPAVPASLQSISNLNSELTPSGLTRFTSGVFNSPAEADAARRGISATVKDAFVIVYKGNAVATTSTSNTASAAEPTKSNKRDNRREQTQQSTNGTASGQATTAAPAAKKQGLPDDGKVVYRIQIGSFTSQVPFDVIQKFLTIRKLGIVNQINDSGLNVFYAGACTDMARAEYMLNQAKAAGLTDATIVATKGKMAISLDEAKSALGQ